MKILITGAAGGIGSTLCHNLLKTEHKILLVDNLRNGYIENINSDAKLLENFYNIDVCSTEFYNLIASEIPDVIVHLAAITSLPDCEVNKSECVQINVGGTSSVLTAAAKLGVKRVIFASTSAVYENTTMSKDGFSECDAINPRLFYSLSKKMGEELCQSYAQNYNLDVVILRLFNVFGPRQDIYRKNPPLINYIVRQLFFNQSIILHSDGQQERDYVYVDDVIETIKNCLDLSKKFNENKIFNVCSGCSLSVKKIVEYLVSIDHKFKNVDVIYRPSDMLWNDHATLFAGVSKLNRICITKETEKMSLGNNYLLHKKFGWRPSNNLQKHIIYTGEEILRSLQRKDFIILV